MKKGEETHGNCIGIRKAELMKALNSAEAGDRIVLERRQLRRAQPERQLARRTTRSMASRSRRKSGSNPAVFNMVNLSNVTNVTFDRIKFDYNGNSDTDKPFVFNEPRASRSSTPRSTECSRADTAPATGSG